MLDTCEQTRDLALIEAIAAALREELSVAIEEQPGFRDHSEAGQVNRAFRVMTRTILLTIVPPGEDQPALLSFVLRRLARRRLEAGLLDAHEVDHLLGLELGGRDDWLVYLILTAWSEIEYLLQTRGPDLIRRPSRSTISPNNPIRHQQQEVFMTLAERLSEFVRAAFTGLWVQSFEHDDAIAEIARLCRQQHWTLATWDIDRGLSLQGRDSDSGTAVNASDPLSAIRSLGTMANPDGTALLVLRNFHRFLNNIEVVQALDSAIAAGKTGRTFVVVLSAVVHIPVELERQFVVIEHDLPGRDQLERIARGIATEPGELPEGEGLTAVLDAAAGLTRVEAENAFSLSLVRHDRVTPGRALGAQGPDVKEKRPADPAPGRRELRRSGRAGGPQVVLHPRPAAGAAGRCPGPRRAPARAAGVGEIGVRQGPGPGDRPAHLDARRRLAHGLAGRSDRGADPPGPADRRRDGAVRHHDR